MTQDVQHPPQNPSGLSILAHAHGALEPLMLRIQSLV